MVASKELDGRNSVIRGFFFSGSYPGQEHKAWPRELCGRESLSLWIAVLDQCRMIPDKVSVAFKPPSSKQDKSPSALACG